MLAKRIIPTLLCRGRQLVKGRQFDSWRSVGVAAQAVRIHQSRQVDELILLDISATAEGRGPDLSLVEELSEVCFMPLAIGGGVRSVQDVRNLLNAGADKVVLCTAAAEDPEVIHRIADAVGCQAVVAAIDVLHGVPVARCGKTPIGLSPVELAASYARLGAGEVILTSVEREGTMTGYDLALIEKVSQAVNVPVIAHGGCGSYEHMEQAFKVGADAVGVGAYFQFEDATPRAAAQYLDGKGIEVRL